MSQNGMLDQFNACEIVGFTAQATARLHDAALRAARELGTTAEDQAECAAGLVTALPAELVRALHRYAGRGSVHNTLLVRGLLPEDAGLPQSPGTTAPSALGPAADAAALTLLAVLSQLGEPFTFASLYEGRLVQHVTPVPGREAAQTSEGSDAVLAWHVEDAFTENRCDFFGLLCLRGEPGAATLVAPARRLDLPDNVVRVLREPRFVIEPDIAHGADPTPDLPVTAVLSGPPRDPEICFDAVYQRPADPTDADAASALKILASAVEAVAVAHVLEPGELLIADNRRVVHGRTVFRPRYDGTDRWLLRTMVCASKRAHRRRGASRALH
ncbi:TauD/TfdA family dioxygenase (plasmid) [Amycolatopsis sp. FU40]|uniref:TauD/TfdA family dioxygenase n=1 Tax=Amycolatopsis sp. FU40 TaxID=2914159 RepID=UPI001F16D4DB|nr:TauD/TfdA family dioxygenase [Amycolatopsis sp. FU40]UKD50937.1 TauD/TfdA family dioxygenase [Amycolatopsis sp. FU40]